MSSKKCSLIWVLLMFCIISFSTKALARNISPDASEMNANPDQRCKRGRITYDLHQISINQTAKLNQSHEEEPRNTPRCHNYL
ncbi:hypothetical protein P8452_30661 [Trifolium repens]|nr:hypothetical protein P8452_30661 [Trifolium repens]